jgi:hypothetical protein
MKNLFKALASFQQEVPIIHKGTQGYGYSYADLTAIFSTINPLLKKHGLGFTQLVGDNNIKTIIFHIESGEQLETVTTIPSGVTLKGMNDFQVLGSAITYIRRYALSSALGLITDKDLDACGEQQPKVEIDVKRLETKLSACADVKALETVYKSLTADEQKAVAGFTIKLKEKLTK